MIVHPILDPKFAAMTQDDVLAFCRDEVNIQRYGWAQLQSAAARYVGVTIDEVDRMIFPPPATSVKIRRPTAIN